MRNPDFTRLPLNTDSPRGSLADWQAALERQTGQPAAEAVWRTMEQIDVRPLYTADDTPHLPNSDHAAGMPPFLHWPYPTMYGCRHRTGRQHARLSTAA